MTEKMTEFINDYYCMSECSMNGPTMFKNKFRIHKLYIYSTKCVFLT